MLWAGLGGLPVFLESITMNSSAREYQGKSTGGGGGGVGQLGVSILFNSFIDAGSDSNLCPILASHQTQV